MKCSNCDANLRYDPASFGLVCDFCGFRKPLLRPEEQRVVEELDFNTALKNANTDWGFQSRTVCCKNCGAVMIYNSNQMSGMCPYCGSTMLVDENANFGVAPSGIIPFSITKEAAIEHFYKWNKWAFWSPEEFRKGKFLGKLMGVYIPYWTFDTDTLSTYSGDFGYTSTDSDGNSTTKWRKRSGVLHKFINDHLVCGSRRFSTDKLLNSVISFYPNEILPYTSEALLGFTAEKYSIGLDEAWYITKNDLIKQLERAACSQEKADTYSKVQMSTEYSNVTFRYVLVPVWLTACLYKGKNYNVAISGHNGKGNCKRPVSTLKIALLVIILCFLFFGIPIFASILRIIFGIIFGG